MTHPMIRLLSFLVVLSIAAGQAIRNTNIADIGTHNFMPEYSARPQWEAMRTRLREQIRPPASLEYANLKAGLAAALVPSDVVFSPRLNGASSDDELIQRFFVPGIQRAGATDAAFRILCSRKTAFTSKSS